MDKGQRIGFIIDLLCCLGIFVVLVGGLLMAYVGMEKLGQFTIFLGIGMAARGFFSARHVWY